MGVYGEQQMRKEGAKRRVDASQLGGVCNKDRGKDRERKREEEGGREVEGRRACFFFGHQQQLLPTSLSSQRSSGFHEQSAHVSTAPRPSLGAVCSCSR